MQHVPTDAPASHSISVRVTAAQRAALDAAARAAQVTASELIRRAIDAQLARLDAAAATPAITTRSGR